MKILFEILKNKPFKNKKMFLQEMEQYKLTKEQTSELYRLITNYQIARYGKSLSECFEIETLDLVRIKRNAKSRKHWRLQGYEKDRRYN